MYVCRIHVIVTMCDSIFVLGKNIDVTIGGYIGVCSVDIIITLCECFNVSKIHIIIPGCV